MKQITAVMYNPYVKAIDPRCFIHKCGDRFNGEGDYEIVSPSFTTEPIKLHSPQSARKYIAERKMRKWYIPDRELVTVG